MKKNIIKQIEKLGHIPSLPHILLKLWEVTNDESFSTSNVEMIISQDPSLTGRILKMVNSPYYGLGCNISSISHAITVVGIRTVRSLTLTASVFKVFETFEGNKGFNVGIFWWHSLSSAIAARMLAQKVHYDLPEEAFVSGLLHDIGKLILFKSFPKDYGNILERANQDIRIIDLEEEYFEINHCEVGRWITDKWNLSPFVSDAIAYHHQEEHMISSAVRLVKIIYLANLMSYGDSVSGSATIRNLGEKWLGISLADIEEIQSNLLPEVKKFAQYIDIIIAEPPSITEPDVFNGKIDQTEKSLIQKVKELAIFQDVCNSLIGKNSIEETLEIILKGINNVLGLEKFLIFLVKPEKKVILGKAGLGEKRKGLVKEISIPLGTEGGILAQATLTGKTISTYENKDETLLINEQIKNLMGVEEFTAIPMVLKDSVVGLIVLGEQNGETVLTDEKKSSLYTFTNQAAIAIYHSTLQEEIFSAFQMNQAINQNVPVGIAALDVKENIISCNKMFGQIVAVEDTEKLIGLSVRSLSEMKGADIEKLLEGVLVSHLTETLTCTHTTP
ncbi:MAG: HDOD domain-containing protein, partial [Thermodesulfobacteriota bacterium]|nr:HDOD domain-containing protein [Thermodesulfobacteriota bacterium]